MDSIKALPALSGRLSCDGGLIGKLSVGVSAEHDSYAGDYEITPLAFDAQVLPTANKLLKKDLVVSKIPYYETTNAQMGTTIYIADEVK